MSTEQSTPAAPPTPAAAAPAGAVDVAALREQIRQVREMEALLAPPTAKPRPEDEPLLDQFVQAMKYAAALSPMVLGVLPVLRRYLGGGDPDAEPRMTAATVPGQIELRPHAGGVRLVGTDPDGVRVFAPALLFDGPTELHRVYSLGLPGLDPQSLRLIERPGCGVQLLARGTDTEGPLRYRAEVSCHGMHRGGSTKAVLDVSTATFSLLTPHAFEDALPVEIGAGPAPLPAQAADITAASRQRASSSKCGSSPAPTFSPTCSW